MYKKTPNNQLISFNNRKYKNTAALENNSVINIPVKGPPGRNGLNGQGSQIYKNDYTINNIMYNNSDIYINSLTNDYYYKNNNKWVNCGNLSGQNYNIQDYSDTLIFYYFDFENGQNPDFLWNIPVKFTRFNNSVAFSLGEQINDFFLPNFGTISSQSSNQIPELFRPQYDTSFPLMIQCNNFFGFGQLIITQNGYIDIYGSGLGWAAGNFKFYSASGVYGTPTL